MTHKKVQDTKKETEIAQFLSDNDLPFTVKEAKEKNLFPDSTQ